MALFELFSLLRYFRERREQEKLSQKELLKHELKLLGLAFVGIVVLIGILGGLAWIFTR